MKLPALLKSGPMRFALILVICEVVAWCVLGAWDARHPQYRSTVVFSVLYDRDGPIGPFGVRTFSFPAGEDDWIGLANKAAADSGATRWQISRPLFRGDTNNLKDVYKHAERLIRRIMMHRYELQEIYHFTVTSDDPASASEQANQTIQKVEESMSSLRDRREAFLKKRFLKVVAEIIRKTRENGDEAAAILAEANIRAKENTITDYIAPLRIWDRAVPNSQRIKTFNYFLTQSVILCLAMVVGVADRVVTSKRLSSGSLLIA